MYGQMLELIIFAVIAFFIISKLISILGSTSEDDPAKPNNRSFFGENGILKDVTNTSSVQDKGGNIYMSSFLARKKFNLKGLVVKESYASIEEGIAEVAQKMPSFSPEKFISGAKKALKIIIEMGSRSDAKLEGLVDKRYMKQFLDIVPSYGNIISESDINALISEVYSFGNNVFIKVLFTGKNISDKIKELNEEWTFTKSANSESSVWYLSNIDRAH